MDYKKLSRVADSVIADAVVSSGELNLFSHRDYDSPIPEDVFSKVLNLFKDRINPDIRTKTPSVSEDNDVLHIFTEKGGVSNFIGDWEGELKKLGFSFVQEREGSKPGEVYQVWRYAEDKSETSNSKDWEEVVAGINEIPCGVINSDHTKFRPYLGKWMDGYSFEDIYGDWPFEDSEKARDGLKEIAEQWGVPVESIETGANDSFEGGYLYVRGTGLGEEIDITEDDLDEDYGSIFLSDDFVETLFSKESPDNSWFWLPPSIDQ